MAGVRRIALAALGAVLLAGPLSAQDARRGASLGVDLCMGIQGSLSFLQAGIVAPRIGKGLTLGLKARLMSSLTWATFIDRNSGQAVSFHPVVAAGVLTMGGASPLFHDLFRAYGGADLLLGVSFTPYDSLIYGTGNLIGRNLTFALLGYFGVELFTAPRVAIFLDAGGGFKSLFGDKTNLYAVASSWLGSGFGFKMGVRFYR